MTEEIATQELIELVSERNLDNTVEEIIRIQERFSVWGHGVGHDIHGEEKAKKEVEEGYKTPWGGPISFSYKLSEYEDLEYRKNKIAHQLRDGYNGRNVWLFFAIPKGLEFSESENRIKAYRDAKATLFKYDNLPAGGVRNKDEEHRVDQSRIIGWMDDSRQFHLNPKFDADKLAEEYQADGY